MLRTYQRNIYDQIKTLQQPVLVQAPCGSGKTEIFSHILDQVHAKGKSAIVCVHRRELLWQTSARLKVPHGYIIPGNHVQCPINIASIQTLARRLHKIPHTDVLIIDEAHHSNAGQWKKVIEHFSNSYIIGFTATPRRLSGEPLGDLYKSLLIGPKVSELIKQGYLSDYKLFCPPSPVNIKDIKTIAGDYSTKDLERCVNQIQYTGDVISHYQRLADDKKTIVFCVTIQHAKDVADTFSRYGYSAGYVSSTMPRHERNNVIDRFRTGDINVLCNVDIVSEGFDVPACECVILLRPTQSLALHLQQTGRALRPIDGKTHAIILDHANNTERHGFPDDEHRWSLTGKDKRTEILESVKICEQCFASFRSVLMVCPYCHAEVERNIRQIRQRDGILREVDRNKKNLNAAIREVFGDNKVQGVKLPILEERLAKMDEFGVPHDHKAYLKVLRTIEERKAKSIPAIETHAEKWGYNRWWVKRRIDFLKRIGRLSYGENVA